MHDLDRALLPLHPFGSLPAAAGAPIRLLSYQLEPAMVIARDGVSRVLIADGVGLGKTIQAGLVLLELVRRDEGCRAIVLTPAGLRDQWRLELSTRLGLATALADSRWLRSLAAERPAHINPWSMPGIYVASHDLVKRAEVLRPIEDVTWDAVVIDEAHAATSGSDRRAALHAIAMRSRHVVLLTATPHDADPREREALMRIGQPANQDEPIVIFRRSRGDVRRCTLRRTRVIAVTPSRAERQMHELLERYSRQVWNEAVARADERARLVSIVLRKRALSSAGSLLTSIERRLAMLTDTQGEWQPSLPLGIDKDEDPVDDDAPTVDLGVPGLGDIHLERHWLNQIAAAAKRAAADERKAHRLLRFLARAHEPVIVFTEYRDTLTRLAERAVAAGHDVLVLHGGLSARERAGVQRTFNEHGGTLLATDAAAEGLNLHHRCRVVVHFELPWNPARLEQRVGRVDRLGQASVVHELALVAAHTAERLVLAPLAFRLAAAGAAGGRTLSALSASSVATAVMTGEPLPQPDEPALLQSAAVPPPTDLPGFAVAEAARLERHRCLTSRSVASFVRSRPSVVATRLRSKKLAPGLYFVFAVSLRTNDGSIIHAEPRLIRVELCLEDSLAIQFSRQQLRDVVAALASTDEAVLIQIASQQGGNGFDGVSTLADARNGRLRQRSEVIARVIASAAPLASQSLVQAGLFDRRALRAAARNAEATAALDDGRRDRDAAATRNSTVTRYAELLAAIHVTAGR